MLLDTYGVYDAPEDGETPVPTKPADLAASYKQYYVPEESDDGTSEEEDAEVQAVADEMQPRESKTNAFELLRRQTAACLARGCGEESSQGTLPEGGTESEDESGISNAPRECLRECGNFGDMMTGIGQLFAPPGKKGAAEKDKQEREEQEQVGEGQWKMRRKSARFAAHNLAADNIIGRPDMRRMDSRMTIAEVEALAQQEVASDESDEDPTVILSRMKRKKKRTRKLGKFGKWFGGGFDPAWNPALQDVEKSWLQTLTAKEFRKEVSTARPVRLEVVPSHAQVWAVEEHAPADTGLAMEHSATVFRKVSRSDLMDPSSDRMERNDMAAEPEKRVGRGFKSLAFREK